MMMWMSQRELTEVKWWQAALGRMNVMKYNCTYKYNIYIFMNIIIIVIVIIIKVCVCVCACEEDSDQEWNGDALTHQHLHTYRIIPKHLYNNQLTWLLFFLRVSVTNQKNEWGKKKRKIRNSCYQKEKSFTNTIEITSTQKTAESLSILICFLCVFRISQPTKKMLRFCSTQPMWHCLSK